MIQSILWYFIVDFVSKALIRSRPTEHFNVWIKQQIDFSFIRGSQSEWNTRRSLPFNFHFVLWYYQIDFYSRRSILVRHIVTIDEYFNARLRSSSIGYVWETHKIHQHVLTWPSMKQYRKGFSFYDDTTVVNWMSVFK